MAELTNREVVEGFMNAMAVPDAGQADQYLADDFIEDFPQSGERIRGRANRRAVIENYPRPEASDFGPSSVAAVIGDDQWVMTPTMSLVRINGSGERLCRDGADHVPERRRVAHSSPHGAARRKDREGDDLLCRAVRGRSMASKVVRADTPIGMRAEWPS